MPTVRPSIFQAISATTTVTPPGGYQAGDLLLAFLSYESLSWTATLTGGTPEWEPLTSKVTSSGTGSSTLGVLASGIWWKPATAGETSWTLGGGPEVDGAYMAMAVVTVADALLEAPQFAVSADQTSTVSGTMLTSITSPAGPTPALGDMELRWVGGDNYPTSASRAWTAPGVTTEVADLSADYVAAQLTRQNTASTAARAHTVSPGVYAAHGFTLRIRPAAVATATVLSPVAAVHRAAHW
ncbi:hypothetical protein [Nonomuraea sp. CA-141351]|uniref:hypothetical protein n=1 Tax=Nonomuraea sp. CA-141351 TaxID=3239996 RepID=UPI003D8DF408